MIRLCNILAVLLAILFFDAEAQTMSTMGTDFWFSFAQGRIEAAMSVTVTGTRACTGVVTNPNTGWSQSFTVPANGSVVVSIDTANSYNTTSGIVTNKGLHLTTTDTVSVYVSNFLTTSFDASFVLPTESLRDEYIVQSIKTTDQQTPSEILVVAIEDSTVVDFYPTAGTIGVSNNATSFSRVMNEGQTLQLKSIMNGDYSGTHVISHDCKPIAVFNAHLCGYIPENTGVYCDHLFEQSLPITYWGKEFVATMSLHHNGDCVKVTALEDNCAVRVNGILQTTLGARQSYMFSLRNNQNSAYIKTSAPATVYQYLMSKNVAGPDGDPSMVLLPPIEQQLKEVIFVNYSYTGQLSNYHCLNVVTRTDNASNILLDNGPITAQFSAVPGNTVYSYARLNVNSGTHHLRSIGNVGFVAHAYGVGSNESYGYSVGFSVKPLNNKLIVNGGETAEYDTVEMCVGDTIYAHISSTNSINISGWYLDDSLVSVSPTLSYPITDDGLVHLSVSINGEEGCFLKPDTLSVYIRIHDNKSTSLDTLVCHERFVWFGDTITEPGAYSHLLESVDGCDSLLQLSVDFFSIPPTDIEYEGCDSIVVGDVVYYVDTRVSDTILTAAECDSIVNVTYTIHPSYYRYDRLDLDEGDTLIWVNGGSYWSDEQHPEMVFTSQYGCDSIVRLQLNIIPSVAPPPQDSSSIWIPSAFTPDEKTNALFKIESNDVVEMHVAIFTRWGLFVTEFDGLTGGWDGTFNGTKCKQETYVYLVEYRTKTMPAITQKRIGTVMLLR